MSELTVSNHVQKIFDDLYRHNLRHPGAVAARIVKLCQRKTVNLHHIADARLEWLKLGLDKRVAPDQRSAEARP